MNNEVRVEVSARHIHMSQEAADILFGKGHVFTPRGDLTGRIDYPVEERVTLVGPKGKFERVGIMYPTRKECQVELSMTDARTIGLDAPIRLSGHTDGTPGIKIIGPEGEVDIDHGVIVAKRHLHVEVVWAEEHNVVNNQVVSVAVESAERSLIFGDVLIRILHPEDKFAPTVHLDTDEGNAAQINFGTTGTVII